MTDNFIREYEIAIIEHATILDRLKSGNILNSGLTENFLSTKKDAIIFTKHQMKADIEYTRKSKNGLGGPAIIKLYNVAPKTLNRIREDNTLQLKAGYRGQKLPLLFNGTIKDISSVRMNDGKLETKIVCGDSINIANSLRISGFSPPATTYAELIEDILGILARNGLPTGNFDKQPLGAAEIPTQVGGFKFYQQGIIAQVSNPTSRILKNGRSYEGTALGELQKICQEINYIFYISLGKIYVEPNFNLLGATTKVDFITINGSQLKKPITPNKKSSGKSESEKDKRGIVIETFLNGKIKVALPELNLNVNNKYKGTYSISSVGHKLDYEGSAWDTRAVLRRK